MPLHTAAAGGEGGSGGDTHICGRPLPAASKGVVATAANVFPALDVAFLVQLERAGCRAQPHYGARLDGAPRSQLRDVRCLAYRLTARRRQCGQLLEHGEERVGRHILRKGESNARVSHSRAVGRQDWEGVAAFGGDGDPRTAAAARHPELTHATDFRSVVALRFWRIVKRTSESNSITRFAKTTSMFASVPSGCRFAIGAISAVIRSENFDETAIVSRAGQSAGRRITFDRLPCGCLLFCTDLSEWNWR